MLQQGSASPMRPPTVVVPHQQTLQLRCQAALLHNQQGGQGTGVMAVASTRDIGRVGAGDRIAGATTSEQGSRASCTLVAPQRAQGHMGGGTACHSLTHSPHLPPGQDKAPKGPAPAGKRLHSLCHKANCTEAPNCGLAQHGWYSIVLNESNESITEAVPRFKSYA